MNNDPIETEGEPVAMTKVIARRDDAPALRELVAKMYRYLGHADACADAGHPNPRAAGCTCGLEVLMADAVRLGCREPMRLLPMQEKAAAEAAASHAAVGGFLGGLAGNLINGLVHGAQARKEARDAKKTPCKPKRAAAARPADAPSGPRRLGPGKSSG